MYMGFIVILQVILLGIIEGITEWLPISSTGHMLLFDSFWPLKNVTEDFKSMFFVVIQLGAILAVVVLFWKKLFPFRFKEKPAVQRDIFSLWGKVLVACLPAAIIGIPLDDVLEKYLHTPLVVSLMLIIYGIAFILVENRNKKREFRIQTTHEIDYKT
ncbi:MAG: undecaprenyl-diphosphate phosphatase, partial [Christensenellaceae bacterium]